MRRAYRSHAIRQLAAIAGIGATEFSKESGGRSCSWRARRRSTLDDAGLSPADVDGMVTFTMDSNHEIEIARSLGIGELSSSSAASTTAAAPPAAPCSRRRWPCSRGWLTWWSATGPSTSARANASAAPTASTRRWPTTGTRPSGLLTPAQWVAMFARRYMHEYGATSEDFGRVAVADRKHAATNPKAWFYEKPDHARGASGVALDRRAAAPARLLPGERRRRWRSSSPPPSGRATWRRSPPSSRPPARARRATRR